MVYQPINCCIIKMPVYIVLKIARYIIAVFKKFFLVLYSRFTKQTNEVYDG